MTEIKVTTTPDVILRHAVQLAAAGPEGETFWERQARTLDEMGYTIVGKDDAAELQRLRPENDQYIADMLALAEALGVPRALSTPELLKRARALVAMEAMARALVTGELVSSIPGAERVARDILGEGDRL